MTERLIAKGLTVTCKDGSTHSDVLLLEGDGKRVYQAPNGQTLCIDKAGGGMYFVSPMIATMILCNCPMEEE
jgi:hypothetical protein